MRRANWRKLRFFFLMAALNLLNGLLTNLDTETDNKIDEDEPYYAADTSEFDKIDRKAIYIPYKSDDGKMMERPIIVIKALNGYHALDMRCHHKGGSLMMGDIEDMDGSLCIRCPFHGFIIKIENGEGLMPNFGLDPITKKEKTGFTSRGIRQRKHKVIDDKITGKIYVVLNTNTNGLDSDRYAHKCT